MALCRYECNRIVHVRDHRVTSGHQTRSIDGESCVVETPIAGAFVHHVSTGFFGREDPDGWRMRSPGWWLRQAARAPRQPSRFKSIATSAQSVDRSWEYLVWKSSQSEIKVTRLYDVASRSSRERRDIRHDGLVRATRLDEAELRSHLSVTPVTRPDRRNSSRWLTIFEFFMEGFALYAASYYLAPQEIATSLVEPSSRDTRAQEPG